MDTHSFLFIRYVERNCTFIYPENTILHAFGLTSEAITNKWRKAGSHLLYSTVTCWNFFVLVWWDFCTLDVNDSWLRQCLWLTVLSGRSIPIMRSGIPEMIYWTENRQQVAPIGEDLDHAISFNASEVLDEKLEKHVLNRKSCSSVLYTPTCILRYHVLEVGMVATGRLLVRRWPMVTRALAHLNFGWNLRGGFLENSLRKGML